jgi:hypothetical protein
MWKKTKEQNILIEALRKNVDRLETKLKYCESIKATIEERNIHLTLHNDRLAIDYRSLKKEYDLLKTKEVSGTLVDLTVKYITEIKPLINKI